jgi:hypothetical protein
MKKLFALIAVFGMLFMGASIFAQDEAPDAEETTQVACCIAHHPENQIY